MKKLIARSTMMTTLGAGILACAQVASAADAPTGPTVEAGPVKVTVGGFIEAAGIYRNRYEGTDVNSSYNGIPFGNSANNPVSELRFSARQSRLSLLVQGPSTDDRKVEAYYEGDFLGGAPSANSVETNSYVPRIRHLYLTYADPTAGYYVLAGQTWSMATLDKSLINPRKEVTPLTIEAQYVPGFTFTRNPQIRFVQNFGTTAAFGISLESPQAIVGSTGTTPAGLTTVTNGSNINNAGTQTNLDYLPDVIAKAAFEPGYGHYEVYGMGRFFRDRVSGSNKTTAGEGVGFGAMLPLIPKALDLQVSGLFGNGIGRYGAAQLADVTYKPDGSLKAIGETQALVGLIGHPTNALDIYAYGGIEKLRSTVDAGYGYGDGLGSTAGCQTTGGTCSTGNSSVKQFTVGSWYKFYKGSTGYMTVGAQGSYTVRSLFAGATTGSTSVGMNTFMLSMRYYPYQ